MRRLRKLSISAKLGAAFGLIVLTVIALGSLAIQRLADVNAGGEQLRTWWLPSLEIVSELGRAAAENRLGLADLMLANDEDSTSEALHNMQRTAARVTVLLGKIRTSNLSEEARGYVASFHRLWSGYQSASLKVQAKLKAKARDDAFDVFSNNATPLYAKAVSILTRLGAFELKGSNDTAAHAETTYRVTLPLMIGCVVLGVLLCAGAAFSVLQVLGRPLIRLTAAVGELADGDVHCDFWSAVGASRGDELGRLAAALTVLRDGVSERQRLEQSAVAERHAKDRRQAVLDGYTGEFGATVSGVMEHLARAAEGMNSAAQDVSVAVLRTREAVQQTAAGARENSHSVGSVAAAAEEMATSIGEINRLVEQATASVRETVEQCVATNAKVESLSSAAEQIGDVVKLISNIAGQTNLLALNATIEAARAGEAGKGFAVVAAEVKDLAAKTAGATEQISRQIEMIRCTTSETAEAMQKAGRQVGNIETAAGAIAVAVEQQTATMRDIAERAHSIAETTNATTKAMDGVSGAVKDTDQARRLMVEAASTIARTAQALRGEVNQFLGNVSNADKERRVFPRRPGNGHVAIARVAGVDYKLPIADISEVSLRLAGDLPIDAGAEVTLLLPGLDNPIEARLARLQAGQVVLMIRDHAATKDAMRRVLATVAIRASAIAA